MTVASARDAQTAARVGGMRRRSSSIVGFCSGKKGVTATTQRRLPLCPRRRLLVASTSAALCLARATRTSTHPRAFDPKTPTTRSHSLGVKARQPRSPSARAEEEGEGAALSFRDHDAPRQQCKPLRASTRGH